MLTRHIKTRLLAARELEERWHMYSSGQEQVAGLTPTEPDFPNSIRRGPIGPPIIYVLNLPGPMSAYSALNLRTGSSCQYLAMICSSSHVVVWFRS